MMDRNRAGSLCLVSLVAAIATVGCQSIHGGILVSFTDSDGDGVSDAHDICPGFDDTVDADADGIPDGCDVLVSVDGLGTVSEDGFLLTAVPADGWAFLGWSSASMDLESNSSLAATAGSIVIARFGFVWPTGVPNLDDWLSGNPQVAAALSWEAPLSEGVESPDPCGKSASQPQCGKSLVWPWPAEFRDSLYRAFVGVWFKEPTGLPDPPQNTFDTADADAFTSQLYSPVDAEARFLAYAANTLAAEIGGRVPWSIVGYTPKELAILLDSREFFWLNTEFGGYFVDLVSHGGMSTMTTPETALAFLHGELDGSQRCHSGLLEPCTGDEIIIAADSPSGVAGQATAVYRTIHWFRLNVIHFTNHWWNGNTEAHWQYRGYTPAIRLMMGTPRAEYLSDSRRDTTPDARVISRTAGCWGTTGFMRTVLRAANIPVILEPAGGHALPHFPTLEDAELPSRMSHADDCYSRMTTTASFPSSALLMRPDLWKQWFRPSGGNTDALEVTNQSVEAGFLDDLDPASDFGGDNLGMPPQPEPESALGEGIANTPRLNVGRWVRELNLQWDSGYCMVQFCKDGRIPIDSGKVTASQRNLTFAELISPACLTPEPPECPANWFDFLDVAVEAKGGCAAVGAGRDRRGEVSPD